MEYSEPFYIILDKIINNVLLSINKDVFQLYYNNLFEVSILIMNIDPVNKRRAKFGLSIMFRFCQ
jgi:hypothetical protein